MFLMGSGIVILFAAAFAVWGLRPRGDKYHRFVGTELEPYVGLAVTAAVALGFTMTVSGAISLAG